MNTLLTSSIPMVLAFVAVSVATLAAQAVTPVGNNETSLALIDLAGKALTVISTIVLAWLAWKTAALAGSIKAVRDDLVAVKIQGEQTHALVDGMAAKPLDTIAVQAGRLAELTKEQGDIDAAAAAVTAVADHKTAEAVAKAIGTSEPNKKEKC